MNEFIDWIQQQDFYEDTTIVISGDHLSMDGSVAQNIPGGYDRKAYFTVLNGPEYTTDTSREYCTLDIFPTIVEAMGAKIDGGKLGLGTSLYSGEETLIERMGLRQLNAELTAASDYYNDVIMSGDETDPDKKKEPAKEMIEQPDGEQYEENRDNFSDPNYTWTAPAVPYYPTYTPPVTPTPEDPEQPGTPIGSDPGTNGGGSQTPVPPTSQTPTPEPPVSTDPLPDPPVSTVPDPQPPVDPTPEPPVTPIRDHRIQGQSILERHLQQMPEERLLLQQQCRMQERAHRKLLQLLPFSNTDNLIYPAVKPEFFHCEEFRLFHFRWKTARQSESADRLQW